MTCLLFFSDRESLARSACWGCAAPLLWDGELTFVADCTPEWAPPGCVAQRFDPEESHPEGWTQVDCLASALSLSEGDWPVAECLYLGGGSDARIGREALAAITSPAGCYKLASLSTGESLLRADRAVVGNRPGWRLFDGKVACPVGKVPPLLDSLVVPEGVILVFGREPSLTRAIAARTWETHWSDEQSIVLSDRPSPWRDAPGSPSFPCSIALYQRETPHARLWLIDDAVMKSWLSGAPEEVVRGLECWPGDAFSPWIVRCRCSSSGSGSGIHLPFIGWYSPDGGRVWFPEGMAPVPRLPRLERFRAAWMTQGATLTVVCEDGLRWHARGNPLPLIDCVCWESPEPAVQLEAKFFGSFFDPEPFRDVETEEVVFAPLPAREKNSDEVDAPDAESPEERPADFTPLPDMTLPRESDGVAVLEEAILARIAGGHAPDRATWRAISEAKARAGQFAESMSCLAAASLCEKQQPDSPVLAGPFLLAHLKEQMPALIGGATKKGDVHLTRCLAALHWGASEKLISAFHWTGALASWFEESGQKNLPVQEWWLLSRCCYQGDALGLARSRDSVLRRLGERPAEFRLGMPDFLGRLGIVAQPARLSGLGRSAIEWADRARGERGRTRAILEMSLDALGLDVGWEAEAFKPRDAAERAIAAAYAWRKRNPQGVLPTEITDVAGRDSGQRYLFEMLRNFSRVLSPFGITNPFSHWAAQSSPFGQALASMAGAIADPDKAVAAFDRALSFAESKEARGAPRLAPLALVTAPAVSIDFCRRVLEYAISRALYVPEKSSTAANQEAAKLAELVIGVALHADDHGAFEKGSAHMLKLASSERFDLGELESRSFSSYHRRGSRQEVASFLTRVVGALGGRAQWAARAAALYAAAALYRCRERGIADAAVAAGFSHLPHTGVRDRRFFVPALAHASCSHPDAIDGMEAAERLLAATPPECDDLSTSSHYSAYQIKVVEAIVLGFAGAGKPPPGVEQWADESESNLRRDMHRAVGIHN